MKLIMMWARIADLALIYRINSGSPLLFTMWQKDLAIPWCLLIFMMILGINYYSYAQSTEEETSQAYSDCDLLNFTQSE